MVDIDKNSKLEDALNFAIYVQSKSRKWGHLKAMKMGSMLYIDDIDIEQTETFNLNLNNPITFFFKDGSKALWLGNGFQIILPTKD